MSAVLTHHFAASEFSRNTYSEHRNPGIVGIGNIPAHWVSTRLKYVAQVNPEVLAESTNPETWIEYVDISNVDSTGQVTGAQTLRFCDAPSRARRVVRDGDTIISTVRTYLRAIGFVSEPAQGMIVSTGFAVARPRQGIHPEYLWYVAQSNVFVDAVVAHSEGVSYPAITPTTLFNLSVWFPPALSEQRSICRYLELETAKIDALIAKKQRLIALLQEKRAAMISTAVTRGLDPDAPMRDSGIPWMGPVPAHWQVKRLKYMAKMDSGHTPSRSVPEYWTNCTTPWITLNDVGTLNDQDYIYETTNCISELGMANSSAHLLPADTVVLSRDATVGKCALLSRPMATSQHFLNWVCSSNILPQYLLQLFRGPMQQEFERLCMGATIRTIGMPDVNMFAVPIPPRTEQQAVVQHVAVGTVRSTG